MFQTNSIFTVIMTTTNRKAHTVWTTRWTDDIKSVDGGGSRQFVVDFDDLLYTDSIPSSGRLPTDDVDEF